MAENNSSKKPRFLPDPSKWIQTAPSTSSAKKPQRPLSAFKNTFATPPTTIKRPQPNSQHVNVNVKKQGSIISNGGFFTPTSIKKGEEDSAMKRGSPSKVRGNGNGKGETIKKSRLGIRADERRSSPADDLEIDKRDGLLWNRPTRTPTTATLSKAMPLKTHRSAPVTSSSSGMSDAIDQDQDQVNTPPRKRRRTTTLSPLFPPGSPVASHMSSDRPITPVPEYVLDIHRRLCGREFVRPKSPTTSTHGSTVIGKTKSRREKEKEKEQRAIDERAHDRALIRRRNREKENEHRLVVGSSQSHGVEGSPKADGKRARESTPVEMPRLAPVIVNTIHHTPSSKHHESRTTPRCETTGRAENIGDAYSPSAVYRELCDSTRKPVTPPKSRQLRRIPTGTSPRSAIPITSPSPSPAASATPAKTPAPTDSRRDFEAVPMQAETLLSWGGDTRTPTRPEPRPLQHHQAGPEIDSTETQSLAPSAASQSFPIVIPSPSRPGPSRFAHLDQPRAGPRTKKPSSIMPETIHRTNTNNTGIPSSRSIAKFPTDFGVAETILPSRPPHNDQAKPTPKHTKQSRSSGSASGWPAFGFNDTTPTQTRSRAGQSPSDSSKKRKTASMQGTQSKLAAFGFFGEKPKKAVRGFEEDWEMEDDLPFDQEPEPDLVGENEDRGRQEGEDERLQAVPLPPPHPELRPAGLRELKRLEATRSTRPPFMLHNDVEHEVDNDIEALFPEIQPSSSSSHTPGRHGGSSTSTSSVTTEDELGMNSSAVAWYEELEDRRSSEFGSVTGLP